MTVATGDGAPDLRSLIGVAFADAEPALPDLESVLGEIEALGGRLRHRQRVRTAVAAGLLCVGMFTMVTGISYIISTHTTTSVTTVPASGGNDTTDDPHGPAASAT